MKSRALKYKDLIPVNNFVIAMFHYDIDGTKKRFILPRLIAGDKVMETAIKLSEGHNVFKWKFYYSNFPLFEQVFNEINQEHEAWFKRIEMLEVRIPYLHVSLITPEELENLH
jgi:hypothetical protein